MKDREILESWKEISAYLGRDIRTCQRWETELRLPIHRLDGSPKARVFAYKDEIAGWLEETLSHKEPLEKKKDVTIKRFKIVLISVLLLVGIVIIAVLINKFFIVGREVVAPLNKYTLVILPFKNNTGDEDMDFWSAGLSDSLIVDLAQSKFLQVISPDLLSSFLKKHNLLETDNYTPEDLKKIAEECGASHLVLGGYSHSGTTLRINITLHDAKTMEIIGAERAEGVGEQSIFPSVDNLTRSLKENFKFSRIQMASDLDKDIGKITTSSPQAYRYYWEGRKFLEVRQYRRCLELMHKAVALDPEFAEAYRTMGGCYLNLGYYAEGRDYFQKAIALVDRLSDRERFMVQGTFYGAIEQNYVKAGEAFNEILKLYPEDRIATLFLADSQMALENWDKVIELSRSVIRNGDKTIYPYVDLSRAFMAKGMYEKAEEILRDYLEDISNNARIRFMLALNYLCQCEFDDAISEAEKAFFLNPDYYRHTKLKGDIFLCRGDFLEAENEYKGLLQDEERVNSLFGRQSLEALYRLQGRFEEAKKQALLGIEEAKKLNEKGWIISFQFSLANLHVITREFSEARREYDNALNGFMEFQSPWLHKLSLFYIGRASLVMNLIDEAQQAAEKIKNLTEEDGTQGHMRYYFCLKGLMELERNNLSSSIEYLNKAVSTLPSQMSEEVDRHALFLYPLAMAYSNGGDLERAVKIFEDIARLTTGRLFFGEIYARSFYHLGKLYEQKDRSDKAIKNYEKFLSLWEGSDPGLEEYEAAQKRLTVLQDLR